MADFSKPKSGVKIVEAENDFPIQEVTFVRIGSAHAVVNEEQLPVVQQLLAKIHTRVAEIYEPSAIGQTIVIDHKF